MSLFSYFDRSFRAQSRYALQSVLKELRQQKLGTFLTILVIAVSMTIPTVSALLWKNTQSALQQFGPAPELTLYLNENLSDNDAKMVADQIQQQFADHIASLHFISREEGLAQLNALSSFNEAIDLQGDNPLPAVVSLRLANPTMNADEANKLQARLKAVRGVAELQTDNEWLGKLAVLSEMIAKTALVCALLMVISVFLVIGNTVRRDVSNSRNQIEVMQLLGATDYFITRPFLYKGMIYGLVSSLLAVIFSVAVIGYFTRVVRFVTNTFQVDYQVQYLSFAEGFFLVSLAVFIGWLSAKLATRYHIHTLDSRRSLKASKRKSD